MAPAPAQSFGSGVCDENLDTGICEERLSVSKDVQNGLVKSCLRCRLSARNKSVVEGTSRYAGRSYERYISV